MLEHCFAKLIASSVDPSLKAERSVAKSSLSSFDIGQNFAAAIVVHP
jgi:hypothetical protein